MGWCREEEAAWEDVEAQGGDVVIHVVDCLAEDGGEDCRYRRGCRDGVAWDGEGLDFMQGRVGEGQGG